MNKALLLLLFSFATCYLSGQAPQFDWAIHHGGPFIDLSHTIATDRWENVYVAGEFLTTVDFDPGPDSLEITALGMIDIFLYKLNTEGHLEWASSITGFNLEFCHHMITDSLGNIYMAGLFEGFVDFDPGPGTNILSASGGTDMFVLKLDTNGSLIWVRKIGGLSGEEANGIGVDDEGNVYTTGNYSHTVDFDPGPGVFNLSTGSFMVSDLFVLKLNSDGDFEWVISIDGQIRPQSNHALVLDEANNLYISGLFNETVDFDPGPDQFELPSIGGDNPFLLKLESDGQFQWVKRWYESHLFSQIEVRHFTVDESGNAYLTGQFDDTLDVDPGPDTHLLVGDLDLFVLKLDAAGDFAWAKAVGNEFDTWGNAITIDDNNYPYITGTFDGTVDFDPGPGTFNLSDASTFILKLDSGGDFAWATAFGDGAGGYLISVDMSYNIYTSGRFDDTVDFDPGPGVFELTSNGNIDVFVHKINQCNAIPQISSIGPGLPTGGFTNCPGDTTTLLVEMPDWTENLSYTWNSGQLIDSITVAPTTNSTYIVNIDYNVGPVFCTVADTAQVTVFDPLSISTTDDLELCLQEEAWLEVSGGTSYQWSTGDTTDFISIVATQQETYTITVTDDNNCQDIDSITVFVHPLPEPTISGEVDSCPGDTTTLEATGGVSYLWSTGSTEHIAVVMPLSNTEYTVTVTDENGCSNTALTSVSTNEALCPPCAATPNAFTPDGDGINDTFSIVPAERIEVMDFHIYDRWGTLVHNNTHPWDGSHNGTPQPTGVYIFKMQVTSQCGLQQLSGELTLIR